LKGAPFSILALLSFSPVPVSNAWLEVHSGYSDKPVSKALYYLQENGFIIKTPGGWKISNGSLQLPLPIGGENIDPAIPQDETPIEGADSSLPPACPEERGIGGIEGGPVDNATTPETEIRNFSVKNRNFSDSATLSSINLESHPPQESKLIPTSAPEIRKNSENPPAGDGRGAVLDPPNSHPPAESLPNILDLEGEDRLVAGCLAEHGITLNHRTRQLLGRITVDDIYGVVGDLAAQGKQGETGLLVVRLEQRAALGVAGRDRVRPFDGDYRRYGRGVYAYLLEGYQDQDETDPDLDPPEIEMDPGDDYDP